MGLLGRLCASMDLINLLSGGTFQRDYGVTKRMLYEEIARNTWRNGDVLVINQRDPEVALRMFAQISVNLASSPRHPPVVWVQNTGVDLGFRVDLYLVSLQLFAVRIDDESVIYRYVTPA